MKRFESVFQRLLLVVVAFSIFVVHASRNSLTLAVEHELVISRGRVIDPQTNLDGIRDIGIDHGIISEISESRLVGDKTIDATGLVVAPGFIDLHQHAWDEESIQLKALDGVTSIFELEVGTSDVEAWYRQYDSKLPIHFGVSIGHIQVRMAVMGDPIEFLPPSNARASTEVATEAQIAEMAKRIEEGLEAGAVAVGFGLAYTPAATDAEVLAMFQIAASHRASCHMHLRSGGYGKAPAVAMDAARLADSAGAALHIVHLQASAKGTTSDLLRVVDVWQAENKDLTGEVYPWTAGMTNIQSAIFSTGWQQRLGIDFHDLQFGSTGERLTEESFQRYRQAGGLVIVHNNTEDSVTRSVLHPAMMIASDGLKGHPRNAGTYARVLGHYVRETNGLDLMLAIKKMTLLPAQRLEKCVPTAARKGRVQLGCDADLTLFDPQTIQAQATYEQPSLPSTGIAWVLVSGTPIVEKGRLITSVHPGRPVRGNDR